MMDEPVGEEPSESRVQIWMQDMEIGALLASRDRLYENDSSLLLQKLIHASKENTGV